jgi:glycosyltransferase involved in cell wall biosynthesis
MESKKLELVFFSRKPRALGNFSVETYFSMVAQELSNEFDVSIVEMPFESKGLFPRLFNAIYCRFKQGDINHITGDIHYVAAFLIKRKTILTVLDCGMLQQSSGIKKAILKLFWFTIPVIKVRHITAISTATKNELLRHVSCKSNKISVVYVCVNEQFQEAEKDPNTDKEYTELLQIGTAPNKNIERLIAAIKDLKVRLTIIGKVSDSIKEKLEKEEIQHNIKDWKLSDAEILLEYQKTDVLTFVSTIEGFGMPIVEANKVGRVVVTSNISSMPEIGGDAAIFVDPFKVSSIRKGIIEAIEDQEKVTALIQKGHQNANRFEVKQIAENYAAIYRKMAPRRII